MHVNVQVPINGRALNEGTVLCMEDRTPVGRVEEVFGPVTAPLYALRWAGPGPLPASLTAGAPLCTTAKLAEYVLPEHLCFQVTAEWMLL